MSAITEAKFNDGDLAIVSVPGARDADLARYANYEVGPVWEFFGSTLAYEAYRVEVWQRIAPPSLQEPASSVAISGSDIKPGMTILLTPGSKPFRVDGVEPFNKSESTFVVSSGPPHSHAGQLVYADRWYCLLGGNS